MPSEAAGVELTRRFQTTLATISRRASRLTASEWDALASWNAADIPRFAERTAPVFTAARAAAVNASAGYYALLGEMDPPALDPSRIGVPPDVRAPFTQHWHLLKNHHPWEEAFDSARTRAESLAADLVTTTSRLTGDLVLGERVVGWRRVLTGESCRWCATVATQRYRTAESANFGHDHCDCTVAPILGDTDPGQVINAERRDALLATA